VKVYSGRSALLEHIFQQIQLILFAGLDCLLSVVF